MLNQKKYEKLIVEYQTRIQDAQTKHAGKFQSIRDARLLLKQVLPEISADKLVADSESIEGNNAETENRSVYCPPVALAIKEKMIEDLTANPFEFVYEHNDKSGKGKAEVFMEEFKRTFTQENIMTEHSMNLINLLDSGTIISVPIIKSMSDSVIIDVKDEEGNITQKVQGIDNGSSLGFYSYDVLRTLIDPNAEPHRVQKTAEWIVITAGEKSAEYIKQKYDVDVSILNISSEGFGAGKAGSKTYLVVDTYKKELEEVSGLENKSGFVIREYFLTNGKKYTILEDQFIIADNWNSARIYGELPVIICPAVVDPESPYGIPLMDKLQPSIELVATAINLVADNTIMRNKFPWVTLKGLIDPKTMGNLTSGMYNSFNNIMELNPAGLKHIPNLNLKSVIDLFAKPEFQEVTNGSQFLYSEGMNNIWLITGLNPANMSGRQEKQIRVESVAEMINQASMRNSSGLVKNLDTYYFNVKCKMFQYMYYAHYDKFPALKERGITRDDIANFKNIRIVNGSYLPEDQMTRAQKAQIVMSRASVNPYTYDPNKAEEFFLKAFGLRLEDFERDPVGGLDEGIIEDLLGDLKQLGPEKFAQKLAAISQQKQQQKDEGGTGEAT